MCIFSLTLTKLDSKRNMNVLKYLISVRLWNEYFQQVTLQFRNRYYLAAEAYPEDFFVIQKRNNGNR